MKLFTSFDEYLVNKRKTVKYIILVHIKLLNIIHTTSLFNFNFFIFGTLYLLCIGINHVGPKTKLEGVEPLNIC